ncbi:MAG: GNAT family N-acetyltransferase [Rhizomicrobium sp.]|jgi:GNAT superfamily N-acetyltransferase
MSSIDSVRTDLARGSNTAARRAVPADIAPLAKMLGRAFADDPMMVHLLADGATRAEKLPRLFELLLKLGMPFGACDVTDGYESASIWRPPGKWNIPIWQYVTNGPAFLGLFGADALRVMAVMDQVEKVHPREPHWYLQAIGTDPDKQGKGFGGVVMRNQLAQADHDGLPAYLESSKEKNIPIYASFGFEVTGEIRLKNGPVLFPMWRKARMT